MNMAQMYDLTSSSPSNQELGRSLESPPSGVDFDHQLMRDFYEQDFPSPLQFPPTGSLRRRSLQEDSVGHFMETVTTRMAPFQFPSQLSVSPHGTLVRGETPTLPSVPFYGTLGRTGSLPTRFPCTDFDFPLYGTRTSSMFPQTSHSGTSSPFSSVTDCHSDQNLLEGSRREDSLLRLIEQRARIQQLQGDRQGREGSGISRDLTRGLRPEGRGLNPEPCPPSPSLCSPSLVKSASAGRQSATTLDTIAAALRRSAGEGGGARGGLTLDVFLQEETPPILKVRDGQLKSSETSPQQFVVIEDAHKQGERERESERERWRERESESEGGQLSELSDLPSPGLPSSTFPLPSPLGTSLHNIFRSSPLNFENKPLDNVSVPLSTPEDSTMDWQAEGERERERLAEGELREDMRILPSDVGAERGRETQKEWNRERERGRETNEQELLENEEAEREREWEMFFAHVESEIEGRGTDSGGGRSDGEGFQKCLQELRVLIPGSSKCHVPELLERTITYVRSLRQGEGPPSLPPRN